MRGKQMTEVKILYEDKDIIVVVKPAGMASQEERSVDVDMVSWLKTYLVRQKKVKGMPYIGVIHRLDKPVGGVMVYAKTQQAAAKLSEQVRNNKMTKEYLAVLTGTLPKKEGRLEDMLLSNGKTNRTEVVEGKIAGAKKAVLEYKVKRTKFEEGQQYSLVNVHLITGRRHQIRVQMGINPYQFRWCLTEGETFFAPQVILSFSNQGFSKLSHQYHDILHEHMCRGRYKHERRPVLINNWEATYFDFNEEKIEKIAAQAGELGIEMMVLDDGWFGKRDDDNSGLGDWFVNEKKIRGGLPKLSEKIHEKGMKFGLWFEPEMISEDSDLYRAHPDWAITIPGRVPNHSRNQLVLDMTRSDVRDYLMARFEEILGNTKIEYVKWDMNRSICDMYSHIYKGEQLGECYHRYILGVYDLLERFVQRFPEILLEGCSGGGGRFDAGMLYYSPQIWCSDNTDAMNRLDIQYGTSFFYPISSVGAHVSACPNHQTGRSVPLSTRADVALAGSFGYELDLRLLSDEEKAQVKEQIKEFHDYYDLTHEGDYYRLTERDNTSFTAWEFVAKNKERALVEVVKKDAWGNPLPVHVAIKGLEDNSMYVCSLNGIKRSGKTWNHAGITLPKFLSAGESMKFTFMKVE